MTARQSLAGKRRIAAIAGAMRDRRLSLEGRGMLVYLLTEPIAPNLNLESLADALSTGRDRMARIVNELVAGGYVERRAVRVRGAFAGVEYRLTGLVTEALR